MDKCVLLVNVYAPNIDGPAFFHKISALMNRAKTGTINYGGAMNVMANPLIDSNSRTTDTKLHSRQSFQHFKDIFA